MASANTAFDLGAACQNSAGGTYGPGASWRGLSIIDSPRYRELDRKLQYFDCTQHDSKRFDFEGRVIANPGVGLQATQPMLSQQQAPFYVPLRTRRPSSPYRLSRAIVQSFTTLIFGESRFPRLRVLGDLASEDYATALSEAMHLSAKMVQARNYGGACGTAAASWAFIDGRPRCRVHNPKTLFVHSWDDRDELIPKHVTQAYLRGKDEWNPNRKRFEKVFYWYRRDWTKDVDIVFKPLRYVNGVDPSEFWTPDTDKSVVHNDGLCHLVWAQNEPNDDIDGDADYEGQFEQFDSLDILVSVVLRGATLNLDPTLVLKMDRTLVERMGVKKGSDNALTVGVDGDAKYLEISGQSITSGIALINEDRRLILESTQCVMPDPDKVAAAATSSLALKMIWRPAIGRGEGFREQYGVMTSRLLEGPLTIARRASRGQIVIYNQETGEEEPVEVKLPPKIEETPILDENENPTGENQTKIVERDPGDGEDVVPKWPEWFPPTPTDKASEVTALTTAAGQGTPIISQQTATEALASAYGKDPAEEWARMQKQTAANEAKQNAMFDATDADAGGKVEHEQQLPGGATIKKSKAPKPPPPVIAGGKPGAPGGPDEDGPTGSLNAPPDDEDEGK